MLKTPVQIDTNGITVWVNSETGCIGRFGLFGIDVHRDVSEQSEKGECLYCTHEKTTSEDWDAFVKKMREYHGVHVSDKYKPKRFRE